MPTFVTFKPTKMESKKEEENKSVDEEKAPKINKKSQMKKVFRLSKTEDRLFVNSCIANRTEILDKIKSGVQCVGAGWAPYHTKNI